MRALGVNLAAVIVIALALAGAALAATQSGARTTNLSTARTGLGRVIVNGSGRTIYLFEKDKRGKSACSGICATYWPPLLANGKTVATGVKASLLGTIRRSDGRLQVTYAHHPLYSFVKDTRKGQTNGEGLEVFGGKWWALSSTGAKIAKPASAGTGTDPGSGTYGGGYGY